MLFQSLLCFFVPELFPFSCVADFLLKILCIYMLPNKYSKYSKGFGCMLSEVF